MGCPIEYEQHSPSAHEQSLLRSLSTIRRSPKCHRGDSDGSDNRTSRRARQDSSLRTDRRGKSVPSEKIWKGSRRKNLISDLHNFRAPPFPGPSVGEKPPVAEDFWRGYRDDYTLGETVRSASHMIAQSTSTQAIRVNDFAFVKRSDSSFTYAILAYRCTGSLRNCATNEITTEECMVFVVDSQGSTKKVPSKQSGSVRLVATDSEAARLPANCATPDRCPPTLSVEQLD